MHVNVYCNTLEPLIVKAVGVYYAGILPIIILSVPMTYGYVTVNWCQMGIYLSMIPIRHLLIMILISLFLFW